MVGSAIKKYASQKNLTVKNGVAYGIYNGYFIVLSDGYNLKRVGFSVRFENESTKNAFENMLSQKNIRKQYKINSFDISNSYVDIVFTDNIGAMKRISSFIDMFTAQLSAYAVSGEVVCAHCGQAFEASYQSSSAVPVLLDGKVYHMHSYCIEQFNETVEAENREEKKNGSVFTGTIGALIGGILGSIPWAIAYYLGWFVGWLGFLIGLAAKKGYEILNGKSSRIKGIVVVLVTILCVVLAEFVTALIGIKIELANDPELSLYAFTFSDIIEIFFSLVEESSEYRGAVISDLVLGLIFAMLGIGSLARSIFIKTSDNNGKVIRLD